MLHSTFNGGCSIFLFSLGICGVTRYELISIPFALPEIYKRGNRVSRILFACFPSLLAFVFEAKAWPGRLEPLGLLFLFEKGGRQVFAITYDLLSVIIGYYHFN